MPTTNSAAIETNQTQLSYIPEVTFATLPTPAAYQAIRYVSESLSGTKNRTRPSEINITREASAAVTTAEAAAGAINGALSYGTYDDFFASCLNGTWQAATTVTAIATDIVMANTSATTATLTSSLGTKWSAVQNGSWIKVAGFVNATNNGLFRVTNQTATVLTLVTPGGATVNETTPSGAVTVKFSKLVNGSSFTSFTIQNKFSSALWLRYLGSYCTSFVISGSIGQFLTSNFNFSCASESSSTSDASNGTITAAPSGVVMNSVGGFGGITVDDIFLGNTTIVDSFSLTVSNEGAAAEYGMGSATAKGMLSGTLTASGTLRMYFADFTLYAYFKSELTKKISFVCKDSAGAGYIFTLPNANLMNPNITSSGPGTAVMAEFQLEGNPSAGATGGSTIQIDRLP